MYVQVPPVNVRIIWLARYVADNRFELQSERSVMLANVNDLPANRLRRGTIDDDINLLSTASVSRGADWRNVPSVYCNTIL